MDPPPREPEFGSARIDLGSLQSFRGVGSPTPWLSLLENRGDCKSVARLLETVVGIQ